MTGLRQHRERDDRGDSTATKIVVLPTIS